MKNKILITGGAGYIGSMLATELVRLNYKVTVIDKLKYNPDSLSHLFCFNNFKLINESVENRRILKKEVNRNQIIIPLAALVGAPLCAKNKKEAIRLNFDQIRFIRKNVKGNQKVIYATTNSGYGVGEKNKYCDENSVLRPVSLYGVTKNDAEKEIHKFRNTVSFRLATVFGYSYRMRTDLLINFLVREAIIKKKLKIFEPNFRRNFVHIKDVTSAILFSIKNFDKLKGEVYNLGLSTANLTKIDVAKKIKKYLPSTSIKIITNSKDPDKRDYFVSNKKIEKKGFKASISLDSGIKELIEIYKINKFNDIKNNY